MEAGDFYTGWPVPALAYLLRLFDGDGGCSDSDVVVVLLW